MEYISAKEFLKQPKEVQEVFIDWWKPSIGDLFIFDVNKLDFKECALFVMDDYIRGINALYNPSECIPMLREGQLRKFIEDKTDSKIIVHPSLEDKYHVGFNKYCGERESGDYSGIVYCDDLLQAYWKVACEIAKEQIQ